MADRRRLGFLLASVVTVMMVPTAAAAAPGDLDTTFGGGDGITQDLTGAGGAVVLSDGASVVVGVAGQSKSSVARYLPDASLDPAFGDAGIALVDGARDQDEASHVVVDSAGRPVVTFLVGQPTIPGRLRRHVSLDVVRFTADGDVDSTFGVDGHAVVTAPDRSTLSAVVTVDSQDRPVVAGTVQPNLRVQPQVFVRRFTVDGERDLTFRGTGRVDFRPTGVDDIVVDATVQPDGKIVVLGVADADEGRFVWLSRSWPAGRFDRGFGGDGIVVRRLVQGSGFASSVAVAGDGDLVLAGGWSGRALLARLLPNGAADRTFGLDGVTLLTIPGLGASFRDVVEQPDGGLLAVGEKRNDLLVARFTATGQLDTTFDADGWRVVDGAPQNAFGVTIGLVPDDRALAVTVHHHVRLLVA